MGSKSTRLSVMMFLQYAIWGAWLPFAFRFFTQYRGIDGHKVGILLSVGASGALIAPFLFGQIADRWIATEKLLGACHLLGALLVWQLARLTDTSSLMLAAFCYSLIYTPTISLTNSLAFTHIADRDRDFGRVRVWGTIGWICAGIGVSQWLALAHSPDGDAAAVAQTQLAGLADSFKLSALLGVVLGLYSLVALPATPPQPGSSKFAPFEALGELKKRRMWALFLIAFPISCVHQFYFVHTESFLNFLKINDAPTLRAIFGAGGGGLMTIGQMSEIVVLAVLTKVLKGSARKTLLSLGLVAYALRFAAFAYLQSSPAAIIFGIALHGLCFGCFLFVAYMIVDEESTPSVKASAQALFNFIVVGCGIIVGNLFAGEVSKRCLTSEASNYRTLYGIPMFVAIACLLALLAIYPRRAFKHGEVWMNARSVAVRALGILLLSGEPIVANEESRLAPLKAHPILDRIGARPDKNSVGHGNNVALYTGTPARFFFATHELGDVFSAVDGATRAWYPDHVELQARTSDGLIEERRVCVRADDTAVAEIVWSNPGTSARAVLEVRGDCRASKDFRGEPGGRKESLQVGKRLVLVDHAVFPGALTGLFMAVGSDAKFEISSLEPAGTYCCRVSVDVPAGGTRRAHVACAFGRSKEQALAALDATLRDPAPLASNRSDWAEFYDTAVPRFSCSDSGLEELYALRWFLLKFSTAGGDLGYFRHPVVLEGREAYQTYCCFSAPFMALDLCWAADPRWGLGHLSSMVTSAYPDGRFPWYVSPSNQHVPIHHRSGTGLSLLQHAAWQHYLIHGRLDALGNDDAALALSSLYQGLAKNMDWWKTARDADGDGLFVVDHPLETGMDDLWRWKEEVPAYGSVDATSYAYLNLLAVAGLARVLGRKDEAQRYQTWAEQTRRAMERVFWDAPRTAYLDRKLDGTAAERLTITAFYPVFAGIPGPDRRDLLMGHLLNEKQFWTRHPIPALACDQPGFDPLSYWMGPSWPAANTHVAHGFAQFAKTHARDLLPQAAELFLRIARNHLQPRADFYERYEPHTGEPLSKFRDYMHSWWIDLFVRHVIGFEPQEDGSFRIDPLPIGLDHFEMLGIPFRGKRITVRYWLDPQNTGHLEVSGHAHQPAETVPFTPGAATLNFRFGS